MHIESTAIVIHHLQTGPSDAALSVVAHDVRQSDKGPSLGPGRTFSSTDKLALARVLIDDLSASVELLDERCLVVNLETLMWYRPRAKTTLCIAGVDYTVPLPSLLFLCHRGELHVKAYKGTKRPSADTELFSAGLPNLYKLGSWCSGGNRLPEHPGQESIAEIESAFFESPFTHSGNEPLPGNRDEMTGWFKLLQARRSFPTQALISSNLTMGKWINCVTEVYS